MLLNICLFASFSLALLIKALLIKKKCVSRHSILKVSKKAPNDTILLPAITLKTSTRQHFKINYHGATVNVLNICHVNNIKGKGETPSKCTKYNN